MDEQRRERIRGWVSALRSGQYAQTQGKLKAAGKEEYCCLGVACELYRLETGMGKWGETSLDMHLFAYEKGGIAYDEDGSMPGPVALWLLGDSSDNNPLIDFGQPFRDLYAGRITLAELNDQGFTFAQLADIVEWYFLSEETNG